MVEKIKRIILSSEWKLYEIQMSLTIDKDLLEYNHPHSRMCHLCHARMAELSYSDSDHMAWKAYNIYYLVLYSKKFANPR